MTATRCRPEHPHQPHVRSSSCLARVLPQTKLDLESRLPYSASSATTVTRALPQDNVSLNLWTCVLLLTLMAGGRIIQYGRRTRRALEAGSLKRPEDATRRAASPPIPEPERTSAAPPQLKQLKRLRQDENAISAASSISSTMAVLADQ